MTVIKGKGLERHNIHTRFMDESLSDRTLLKATEQGEVLRILPDLNVLKIGGQSIMDRGRPALFPILDEIVENRKHHKMILGTGGGTRSRHVYNIALELGLPVGIVATLGSAISKQNARMVEMLMAKHGGIFLPRDHFEQLAQYLEAGAIPITCGMPPNEIWEKPSGQGRIPTYRTDAGAFLMAEYYGARSMIYIKDEDGLYAADPKKDPEAEFIPEISIDELIARDLQDLVVERVVIEMMQRSVHVKRIQIVNGLKPGNITRALNGDNAGTVIFRE